MDTSLSARIAVVTGGGAGIGGAISCRLGSAGARVLVVDVSQERAASSVSEIERDGGRARALVCDIREADGVAQMKDAAFTYGEGRVDVLVNNVGDYAPAGLFAESTEADWDALYAVNLQHVFRSTRALLPGMLERGAGAIVNVSTIEAFRGIPACAVYSAFKAGVSQFTRSLAIEVAPRGVRVNAIAPDVTETPQLPYHRWVPDSDRDLIPSWVPVGRFGRPRDAAEAALFLASDASSFVTGHTLPVDGGTLAAGGWYREPGRERWTNRPRLPRPGS